MCAHFCNLDSQRQEIPFLSPMPFRCAVIIWIYYTDRRQPAYCLQALYGATDCMATVRVLPMENAGLATCGLLHSSLAQVIGRQDF